MIIQSVLELLYSVFLAFTLPIAIPTMPNGVEEFMNSALEYIGMGISIVRCYVNLEYLMSLFAIVMIVDAGIYIFRFIMWVVRKVPFINVS